MNGYVLAVLSHGDPGSPYAEDTLRSFVEHVAPAPSVVVYRHDGPGHGYVGAPFGCPKVYRASPDRLGFCRSTAGLWFDAVKAANDYGCDHVFWLEHDFRFVRPVELNALGAVLRDTGIAQVSLMRTAVNTQEKRTGGVVAALKQRGETFDPKLLLGGQGYGGGVWLEHRAYFTTNPSLMRAEFMHENWFGPGRSRLPYDIECEGRYGIELRDAGWRFAIWGDGTPWVEHIGTRNGHGY